MLEYIAVAALAVSSQISEVTVYNDRAQVVRTAQVELEQGINTVVFEDLPRQVDARGIQVEGSGSATVLDVRFKTENLKDVDDETWQELYVKRDDLQDQVHRIEQQIDRLGHAKNFLTKISEKVTHSSDKEGELALDPAEWENMLQLYGTHSAQYDAGIMEAEQALKDVRKELEKVEADMREAGADTRKQRRIVEVDLEASTQAVAELKLSYLVHGPGWVPTYDIRVDGGSRMMEIKYFALVRQNTGEDWSDAALKLSTARPGLGGRHPDLDAWRIDEDRPRVRAGRAQQVNRYARDYDVETGQRTAPVVRPRDWEEVSLGVALEAEPAMETRGTSTSIQGTAVVFEVDGTSDIASDNVEHRVAVSSLEVKAHFRYSCVPKLDKYVYLKAQGRNNAEYPLLPGKANVFLDGSYVATSELELVVPGEDFWAFLGTDESVKVDYKVLNKHESREGFTGKTVRHTFEYLFKVKNTHSTREELIIFDQLPISGNEEIKVELVEPRYAKNTAELEINNEKRIKWFLILEPGEEKDVPFTFYVEASKDVEITGLE